MSALTNNVYKPRYTIAYLASSKVWPYKNSRLRRIVSLRGRRFFRGGLFRRYVLVATTRKWTEARRRFRPFRLRLGRGRTGGVGLSVLGRPRRRRYRDVFYTKQQLRAFHGKRSERWIQNALKRSSFHATAAQGVRSRSFVASLESRLDRILFRSRLFPTIFACHQYIHHLGLSVNGILEFSPQAILRPGDSISLVPSLFSSIPSEPRSVKPRSASEDGSASSSFVYADTQEPISSSTRFKWPDSSVKRLARWRTVYWDLFCRIYYRRWGLFTLRRRHLTHLKKKLRPFVRRHSGFGVSSLGFLQISKRSVAHPSSASAFESSAFFRASQTFQANAAAPALQKFRQYVKLWLALRLRSSFLPRISDEVETGLGAAYRRSRPSRRRIRHRFVVARRRKAERASKTPRLRPVHFYTPAYLHRDSRTLRTVRLWSPTSETVVYPFRASPAQIEVFYRSRGFLFFLSETLATIVRFPICFRKCFFVFAVC